MCEAAVVTAIPPAGNSPSMAMLSAIVAFKANETLPAPQASSRSETACRAPNTAMLASSAAWCEPRPGPPNDVMAPHTASMTTWGLCIVVAALSK